ncbi:14901_t:CDS:2 [Racocetra fulgida]|uniref:14901_t:CDS:1 n=1 Tax=Racocetra fulgida TaxID=60492 RepID=A0A9N8Z0H4_9GLOM|nr:14901_t:CDS:2 [Racocetra fulgida]
MIHQPLESGRSVCQAKWYYYELGWTPTYQNLLAKSKVVYQAEFFRAPSNSLILGSG